jgi:hypothetical protein
MERTIAAVIKIQRAWRNYRNCPYCGNHDCNGLYNQFECSELWDLYDLMKLDDYLDRLSRY